MNVELIRNRYLKDSFPKRLGALSANLARIASCSKRVKDTKVIKGLLQESEYFIEWTVPDIPVDLQEKLVELQIWLGVWLYRFNRGKNGFEQLAKESERWSEEILGASGLIDD